MKGINKNNLFVGLPRILFLLATPLWLLACQTSNNVKNEQGTMMSEGEMVGCCSCSPDRQKEACDAEKIDKE